MLYLINIIRQFKFNGCFFKGTMRYTHSIYDFIHASTHICFSTMVGTLYLYCFYTELMILSIYYISLRHF